MRGCVCAQEYLPQIIQAVEDLPLDAVSLERRGGVEGRLGGTLPSFVVRGVAGGREVTMPVDAMKEVLGGGHGACTLPRLACVYMVVFKTKLATSEC